MPKPLKVLLITLGSVLALAVIALAVIAATFDPNDYKPQLVSLVQEKQQRTLEIPGRIELSFFPNIGAELGEASLSERNEQEPFASVQSARVSLALWPLLQREFVVDRVQVTGLRATLRRQPDGSTNIDDLIGRQPNGQAPPAGGDGGGGSAVKIDIRGIEVRDAQLVFDDRREKRRFELALDTLKTGRIAPGTPGKVELQARLRTTKPALDATLALKGGYEFDPGQGRYALNDVDATLKGTLDQTPLTVSLDVGAFEKAAEFSGKQIEARIVRGGPHELDVKLNAPTVTGAGNALRGSMNLALARKQGDTTLAADANGKLVANLEQRTGTLELAGRLDGSDFTAKLWLDQAAPLAARFDVAIDTFNADRWRGTDTAAAAKPDQPEPPLDLTALKDLNLRGTLRVNKLQVAGLQAQQLRVETRAAGGRLNLDPVSAKLYEGATTGSVTVTATAPARFTLKQTLAGVSLGPLLKDLTGNDRVQGRGRVMLDVSTQGQQLAQLKQALNGSARIELRDGVVRGFDLGRIVRLAKATGTAAAAEQTEFTEMSASFNLANGVARTEDILAVAPLLRVTGAGDINLVQERLDVQLKATLDDAAVPALSGKTVPVRLSGPFSSVGYSVDVGKMVEEKAKEKVKEKIERKLEKELGDKFKGLFGR